MIYASLDNLIADYLPEARSQTEKDAIERILEGVSAFVDTFCRRPSGYFLPASDSPSVKRIRGEGTHYLRLPVHFIGSVSEVDYYGIIPSENYYESEKNGWLYLDNNGVGVENTFSDACNNRWLDGAVYKVKARWGYEATPADLSEAVRITVARIWETQKGTLGQITPNGFVIERALPPFAKEVLGNYKKRQFEI